MTRNVDESETTFFYYCKTYDESSRIDEHRRTIGENTLRCEIFSCQTVWFYVIQNYLRCGKSNILIRLCRNSGLNVAFKSGYSGSEILFYLTIQKKTDGRMFHRKNYV